MQLRKVAWLNIYQPRNDAKNPLHSGERMLRRRGHLFIMPNAR